MTILNQPKNTSQYIQVSGRVEKVRNSTSNMLFYPLRPETNHIMRISSLCEKLYMGLNRHR